MVPSGRKWPESRTVISPSTTAAKPETASATGSACHGDQP